MCTQGRVVRSSQQKSKYQIMIDTKKQYTKNEASADKIVTRHASWRNHRRHTGLKLIRFS